METAQELRFQSLIIKNIELANENFEDRWYLLKDFNEHKTVRYNRLCDVIYEIVSSNNQEDVFITYDGKVHLEEPVNFPFFPLLKKNEFTYEYPDIIYYLNIALDNLNANIIRKHFYKI